MSNMGVSKNRGTPKWMVKIMEHPIYKWMIWGVPTHHLRKHPKVGNFQRFRHFWPQNWGLWKIWWSPWTLSGSRLPNPYETPGVRGSSLMTKPPLYFSQSRNFVAIFYGLVFMDWYNIYKSSHGSCGKWRTLNLRDLDNLWKLFS